MQGLVEVMGCRDRVCVRVCVLAFKITLCVLVRVCTGQTG